MNEDPAIKEAKALWNAKQPKEAMLLLFERINELNAQLAASDLSRRSTESFEQASSSITHQAQRQAADPGKGYIARSLVSGEYLIFRTGLHWWAVVAPPLVTFVFVWLSLAALFMTAESSWIPPLMCPAAILAGLMFIPAYLNYRTAEFGVTNRRILIKTGIVNRKTLELNLGKVESFRVEDPLLGRLLGYNNLVITGSGGTHQKFAAVKHGDQFRRIVIENATEL